MAFSPNGELFVGNRHNNVLNGVGSVSRFAIDCCGNFVANGRITGNELEAVHGVAFDSNGELFAVNLVNGKISRFLFDQDGTAIPNGTIDTLADGRQGIAFSPQGEMFVTGVSVTVLRYLFDAQGQAIPNGSMTIQNAINLAAPGFNTDGELFIPDAVAGIVYRFEFDGAGVPIPNGTFNLEGIAGIAFSGIGELFVASLPELGAATAKISRFLFDEDGNLVPNGLVETVALAGPLAIRNVCDENIDCNTNGVVDQCDIIEGTSNDCNSNGIPDECENPACQNDQDCDGVPDASDVCPCTPCFVTVVDNEGRPKADMNGDCRVDLVDFASFAAQFGATDCP